MLQIILQSLTQRPRPLSMDHEDLGKPCKNSVINKFSKDGFRFRDRHATHINLWPDLCRFSGNRRSNVNFIHIFLGFFTCDKPARAHLDNRAQTSHLNGEFLPLNGKHTPLLCKAFDKDNIAALNVVRTNRFPNRPISHSV